MSMHLSADELLNFPAPAFQLPLSEEVDNDELELPDIFEVWLPSC